MTVMKERASGGQVQKDEGKVSEDSTESTSKAFESIKSVVGLSTLSSMKIFCSMQYNKITKLILEVL